jgi:acylphosphatase
MPRDRQPAIRGRLAVLTSGLGLVNTQQTAADIVVQGRVQGVGFRDFAQRRALTRGLVGYVLNLQDGRVRVQVEGARGLIEELIGDLEKGPPLSRVERVTVRWRLATGHFNSFAIRYAEPEP